MRFRLVVDGEPHEIEVVRRRAGMRVLVDGATYAPRVTAEGEATEVRIGRSLHRIVRQGADVLVDGERHVVVVDAEDDDLSREPRGGPRGNRTVLDVRPPMPGRVVRVAVGPGTALRRGQPVAVLEAMKMQNEIPAPADGTVVEVCVQEGETIGADRVIVRIESA